MEYHIVRQKGFTLIEMAIVLLVIALVIGGILMGGSMMRASQLKSITAEFSKYTQAVVDFRDKYQALPGDMANAESFWGSDTTCPGTPYTAVPHMATCNGDGNGHVSDILTSSTPNYELFRAWQELADAGMIDSTYTGVAGTGGSDYAVVGQNVPASKLSGAGYTLMYTYAPFGTSVFWPADYQHILAFGSIAFNEYTYGPILSPVEALAIDTKLDDGQPGYGKITAPRIYNFPNCLTTDAQSTTQYNVAYTSAACPLFYLTGF